MPLALLRKACALAAEVEHQVLHNALAVADVLHDLEMDDETLAAAVLHLAQPPGHLQAKPEDIEAEFSKAVADMLADLKKIGAVAELHTGKSLEGVEEHTENLRRMLLTIAEDVRVVVIILAERLHWLRLLKQADSETQRLAALETRDLHAPLANRLGIWRIKWELEDFILRYLEPAEYKRIAKSLDGRRAEREGYIQDVINLLIAKCEEAGISAEIAGRPKHIYSIWKKMNRKQCDIDGIFDLLAVRVVVDTVAECYMVLGFVHGLWRYIPGEFDDYIATPKGNMYRSLHTAVIGPEDKPLEVQIRTHEMHEHAERGVAAHWAYKENRGPDAEFQRRLLWMRHWLELKEEAAESDFVERFKSEFEPEQVYVFTPQGKVIELPSGATPLDFAYAIHSDVGHRCRGAKVDGRIVTLTQALQSGVTVEVLTVKEGGPSRDWLSPHLGYLKTSRARNRVRQWFRQQDYDQHLAIGKASLEREIERLGLERPDLQEIAQKFNFKKGDDLLAAIGSGEVSPVQVANSFGKRVKPQQQAEVELAIRKPKPKSKGKPGKNRSAVVLDGVGELMYVMARCCKPVPCDPIVGFITRGRGVTVHRADCPVVRKLPEQDQARLIRADWSEQEASELYPVDILVTAGDRRGLLRDISAIFSNEEVDVLGVASQSNRKKDLADFRFTVEVAGMGQLSRVLDKIAQLPDVMAVRRRV
ncbi:MAG: bifunctional (p)ppGpp synthetase/guanosine-3',5'-bis(diphosphate) 3'-pyrophosphohydrolase [Gammaproteobacteria bacterium]|nr:bifunctional (p)ppGpp synthetase/guanosine-3',5'-bis(diphosphate) 3'-pyrophosphohydrolase [Gammaproteobacteria bacterium]